MSLSTGIHTVLSYASRSSSTAPQRAAPAPQAPQKPNAETQKAQQVASSGGFKGWAVGFIKH